METLEGTIYQHRLPMIAGVLLLVSMTVASPLRNVPQVLIQPNGDTLRCLASGDEFYHWLHDFDNYTIIQDAATSYFVYAVLQNDELAPSAHIAGKADPASVGLTPGLNIPLQRVIQKQGQRGPTVDNTAAGATATSGSLFNLVLFIQFNGERIFTGDPAAPAPNDRNGSAYTRMFNDSTPGANSLHNYFKEVSGGSLQVRSYLCPGLKGGISPQSIMDSHPRAYYQPYNRLTNRVGYIDETERAKRERELLVGALFTWVNMYGGPGIDFDGDHDGVVDNITFILSGSPDGWGSLLWPHKSNFVGQYWTPQRGANWYIRISNYNVQLQTSLLSQGVGVLSHEFFHSLGAPDLYHYSLDGIEPVGIWDLMADNPNPPEHMSGYMKERYGKWIGIPTIASSGRYTLSPGQCLKVPSPNSKIQYFVLEYRRRGGTFESSLPGSGLLVYRIDRAEDGLGNAGGPPDEVYLLRPGGSRISNGDLRIANFSSDVGRTALNINTNPSAVLSDGSAGGLIISNIGAAGPAISFSLTVGSNETAISGDEDPDPHEYSLSQNYPNPFNPTTTIRYVVPHRSHVTLIVFNTLGQKVAELENGDAEAGYHEVKCDGSRLASGVYFYRLQAGEYVQVRSFCLLK